MYTNQNQTESYRIEFNGTKPRKQLGRDPNERILFEQYIEHTHIVIVQW